MHQIHNQINSGAYPNTKQLADQLEVHPSTIERDLNELRNHGAPIEYDRKRRGFYYTHPWSFYKISLSEGETVALFLGQKLLAQYRGTPFAPVVESAFRKLQVCLPDYVTVDLDLVGEAVSFDVPRLRGNELRVARYFQGLGDARQRHHRVVIRYWTASRDEVTTRKIDPYHIHFYQGAWYVIGFCHLRGKIRTFAVDRIRKFDVTQEEYKVPPDFDIKDYLAGTWGIEHGTEPQAVRLQFAPEQARWVRERVWHPSQRLEDLPDGSLLMTVTVSGLGEVKRWLLQFGAGVRVLEPEALRQEVVREVRGMVNLYPEPPRASSRRGATVGPSGRNTDKVPNSDQSQADRGPS